ncbi:MAG: hypothetical protein Q9160_000767 [Pyrenula sp. 1 TL-2023]
MFLLLLSIVGYLQSTVSAQKSFSTANFAGLLADGSQVLQSLKPNALSSFDFSPSDFFPRRNNNSNYHTGDLTFRFRSPGTTAWTNGNTATARKPVTATNSTAQGILASANLGPTLGSSSSGLAITRTWSDYNGDLALNFTIQNTAGQDIEIGSLGMPIEFNNIFTGRTATDTRDKCVLIDPYIGLHAGYVQATRLTGTGPQLVITPLGDLTKLEAWRFLTEPAGAFGYQSQTFEGLYEWQVYSKAYAQNEWNATTPWNEPTSVTLSANQTISVGLRFSVANSIPEIEDTVSSTDTPLAVGIPGYIIPQDVVANLYLNSQDTVSSVTTTPANAFTVSSSNSVSDWTSYTLTPSSGVWGRVRLNIAYSSGKSQSVHYYITKSAPQAISDLANFLTTEQYFTDTSDPFGRAPSVISYDQDTNRQVTQDNRAWIAGLSDEGGAGSWLAAAMKQSALPDASQVAKLEDFVTGVVWGTLQVNTGADTYAVRKSVFYYEPTNPPGGYVYDRSINWNTWSAWNKDAAYSDQRAYDYVHVVALYWALYRAGRAYPSLLTQHDWSWYLNQSYQTVSFMVNNEIAYWDVGLMEETVFGSLLTSLYAENLTAEASAMESLMRRRQSLWATQPVPYGSEMAWDSTGQEGVYYWSAYFNDTATAAKTVDSVTGYMPTVPHWGYNGNARRYWDFLYAGKTRRYERMIHHYGSGLNALVLLAAFRSNPAPTSAAAIHQLRTGFAGNQGPLTNISPRGSSSLAFHSFPDTLAWDGYSGDYGPNFLGGVLGAGSYLLDHPTFGWSVFGGNIVSSSPSKRQTAAAAAGTVTVVPRDAVRRHIFIASSSGSPSLDFAVDAGVVAQYTYDPATGGVEVTLANSEIEGAASANETLVTVGAGYVVQGAAGARRERERERGGGVVVGVPGTVSVGRG